MNVGRRLPKKGESWGNRLIDFKPGLSLASHLSFLENFLMLRDVCHLVGICFVLIGFASVPGAHGAVTANLVINGDLETGDFTGWTTTNGMEIYADPGAAQRGTDGLQPGSSVGDFSFTGGTGPAISTAFQTVPLPVFATAIDSGTQAFTVGVALQSRLLGAADTASAIFRFQDAAGNLLGSELSFVDPPTGAFDWTEFSQSGIIPVGARQLEIEVDSRRSAFLSSDAYIDNISFQLIPEASTTLLGGFASLLLLLRRSR